MFILGNLRHFAPLCPTYVYIIYYKLEKCNSFFKKIQKKLDFFKKENKS